MENHQPKLLVATDYSQAANIAEMYAFQMAESTGFEITSLHVYDAELTTPLKIFNGKPDQSVLDTEREKLKKHTQGILKTIHLSDAQIEPQFAIRHGNAGKEILKEIEENEYDFVIVGTHGVSGIRDFFAGSNAWMVIRDSNIPVLAIPSEGVFNPIKQIAFATEYRDGEIPAVNFVKKVANKIQSDLKVIHIRNPFIDSNIEEKLYSEFSQSMNKLMGPNAPEIVVWENEDVARGLNEFCTKENAEWLVMSPEIPTLLEKIFVPGMSMTKRMSFLTSIPLLAIPDYYHHPNEHFWNDF